ncbi:zinc finger protein 271-like [Bradysia coprophila]|uniref:zinc finger protein 271-like n=1 Tax=Bradysia coprophila TaxID=38358 RepID=UPI00187DBB6A|nr:zinc finger protein 271-like [Bradysia coprophila]
MNVEFISVENIQPSQSETNLRCTRSSAKNATSTMDSQKSSEITIELRQKADTKTKQRKFHCPVCKMSFTTKKACELHSANQHNGASDYKCDVCETTFDHIDKLSNHVRKHDRKTSESERYQCNICLQCFKVLSELESHVSQHFELDVRYKCTICENAFFDVDRLVKHTTSMHSNNSNISFDCYVCGNLFASTDEFVKHDHDHKTQSVSLNCSECGETFSSLLSLNSHRKTHTTPRTQPYACQKCTLRFSRSEDLHNHIRVHDGKSIYSCVLCDRMFAHSKNLTNHVHKSHQSCFAADEMDLIDFVVEAEVASQVDRNKMERIPENEDVQLDGDVFKLNVRELVTKYMNREIPSSVPSLRLLLFQRPPYIPENTTRKLTELFRKYSCPLCDLVFVKAKTLEIHCKRNHYGKYTLDQLKDIQTTADRNSSESFARAILNTRITVLPKHECPSCNKMYESRQELIEHLNLDHNGNSPFKCAECVETFTKSNELAAHVLNHPVKRHECKYCRLTFMNLYSLGKHTKRHEGPNTETCSICNIPYREKKDLVKHMRIHADGKPHKCLFCDKRFAQSCDRQKHMRIHTGERPYVCKICGKSFAHLTSIKKHNYVHTGERAFQCTTCGKSFQHSSNLVVHNRTHTGERPYKCKICEKTFYASGHYVDHMKIHIGIKNYECEVCKKSFIHLSSFQKHKRVHSGEKPYVCQFCNRAFSQSGHYREHVMIHSGEKPHKCNICGKSFRRSDALHCHQKTHKKEISVSVAEVKDETNAAIMPTYTLSDITFSDDGNLHQMQLSDQHHQSELITEVSHSDIESITVVRTHQNDMSGDQTISTFSCNFIL